MHDKDYEALLAAIGTGSLVGIMPVWVENAYNMHNIRQYIEEIQSLYRVHKWLTEYGINFSNKKAIQGAFLQVLHNCLKEITGDLTDNLDF